MRRAAFQHASLVALAAGLASLFGVALESSSPSSEHVCGSRPFSVQRVTRGLLARGGLTVEAHVRDFYGSERFELRVDASGLGTRARLRRGVWDGAAVDLGPTGADALRRYLVRHRFDRVGSCVRTAAFGHPPRYVLRIRRELDSAYSAAPGPDRAAQAAGLEREVVLTPGVPGHVPFIDLIERLSAGQYDVLAP